MCLYIWIYVCMYGTTLPKQTDASKPKVVDISDGGITYIYIQQIYIERESYTCLIESSVHVCDMSMLVFQIKSLQTPPQTKKKEKQHRTPLFLHTGFRGEDRLGAEPPHRDRHAAGGHWAIQVQKREGSRRRRRRRRRTKHLKNVTRCH